MRRELMDYGFVFDGTFKLSWAQQRELVKLAADLGYTSGWAPGGVTSRDGILTALQWAQAAGGRLRTGTSVTVAPFWTPASLASQAATAAELTDGRFVLGIGSGAAHEPGTLAAYDMPVRPVVSLMRDYLHILRGLLDGEEVDYSGKALSLRGVRLGFKPPRVPIYVGALGPQMVKLAGELADGVIPSWSSPEQVAWGKQLTAAAARKAGREPSDVKWVGFVRMCIDQDADRARRAFAESLLRYGLARPGADRDRSFRAHFARMGFDDELRRLEAQRDAGTPIADLVDVVPIELMQHVGYFGGPEGAPEAFHRLARGLDTALLRMITTEAGPEKVALALESVQPARVEDRVGARVR
ncbi:MAG TPA: LLM class flavin-dependent oxidoreductase [Chloroflexota bacterium]|nr:LLM class flavin-dependent oxidoreductase [Chloroflexota bacterium]